MRDFLERHAPKTSRRMSYGELLAGLKVIVHVALRRLDYSEIAVAHDGCYRPVPGKGHCRRTRPRRDSICNRSYAFP
jgi:hypothetical protein